MLGLIIVSLLVVLDHDGVSAQWGRQGRPGYGGYYDVPQYRPGPSNYPNSCGATMTIDQNSRNTELYSPLYPNRALSGTTCKYKITRGPNDGYIVLTFHKAESKSWFNITAPGGKSWKFDGTKGLYTLATAHKSIEVKYKAPGHIRSTIYEQNTAFLIFARWEDGSINDHGCTGLRKFSCETTPDIGFICLTGPERCNGVSICPDKSDEKRCDVCLGDPHIDFGTLGLDSTYRIFSSGWPGEYANNNTCQWVVTSPTGYVVLATLISFSTENPYDYLIIGEGENPTNKKSQMTKLAGAIDERIYMSSYPSMWLLFQSDFTVRQGGFVVELSVEDALHHRDPCAPREFDCAVGVCQDPDQTRCDGVAACVNFKDEYHCDTITCDGDGYLCNSMNQWNFTPCVPETGMCDRSFDCPSKDDESMCHIIACPYDCECTYVNNNTYGMIVKCNREWTQEDIDYASRSTHVLELTGGMHPELEPGMFAKRHGNLRALSLANNNIKDIMPGTFEGLDHLTWLNLSYNKIRVLRENFLEGLKSLQGLILWNVPIREIESSAFSIMSKLHTLALVTGTGEAIITHTNSWLGLQRLDKIYVDNHRLCCHDDIPSGECVPVDPQSPLFHCGNLFQANVLRPLFWMAAIAVLVGNAFLISWKTRRLWQDTAEKPHRVQNIFVWNLGVGNILMGFYLVIITAAESYYGEEYYIYSEEWWASFPCRLAGFLSLLSAESCVFFLVLISIDVYYRVKNIDNEKRMDVKTACKAAIGAWIVAGIIALSGAAAGSPESEYYYLSDVCIGLPLIRRPSNLVIHEGDAKSPFGDQKISINVSTSTKSAWVLSIFLFMVLNVICFIVCIVLYAQHSDMVSTLRAQWRKEKKAEREREEEERIQEMEKRALENALDSNDEDECSAGKGADDVTVGKEEEEQDAHVKANEKDVEMGVQDEEAAGTSPSDTKEKRPSVKKPKKRLSIIRRKTKQKLKRTDKKEKENVTRDVKEATMNTFEEDGEGAKEGDQAVKVVAMTAADKESATEVDRHYDTESQKQDSEIKNGDNESVDISISESEPEPYDKQTCRMYHKMKRVFYVAMFCWLPLVIMAFLTQCGLAIPVIAYTYSAAVILPAIAFITPFVIILSTCMCFEADVPSYIVNSEGEIRRVTDFDIYQQTWMMIEI